MLLFLTLVSGIINWVRQKYNALSALAIILSLLIPIVTLIYNAGRSTGLNESTYLFTQLKAGDIWAVFLLACYLFLLVWWYFFVSSFMSKDTVQRLAKLWHTFRCWLKDKLPRKEKKVVEDGDKRGDRER